MHTLIRLVLVPFVALLVLAPPLRAGDEAEAATAAERLYQQAWWAETAEGALDRALTLYGQAADAEGPAAVRAKATYRQALVLERIGRTGDAIRALERLAEAFPDERDLLAEARRRLEEWTALDLRTSFDAWYRRYQYGPEFQARIVDLVLALGGPDDARVAQASQELLTIGEPAVAALRAHVDSSNASLRDRVVHLLLQLGVLPPPDALLRTVTWRWRSEGWAPILSGDPAAREALRAGLAGQDDPFARVLSKVSQGPAVAVAVLSGDDLASPEAMRWGSALARAVVEAVPAGGEVERDLASLVTDRRVGPWLRERIASALLRAGRVDAATRLRWLAEAEDEPADGSTTVVSDVLEVLAQRGAVDDPGTWRLLVPFLARPTARTQSYIDQVLLLAVAAAPADADLSALVAPLEARWLRAGMGGVDNQGLADPVLRRGALRLADLMATRAVDPRNATQAVRAWAGRVDGTPGASRTLLAWADLPREAEVRATAAKLAGALADEDTVDGVIDAIGRYPPDLAARVLDGLQGNRRLGTLGWSATRLRRLFAVPVTDKAFGTKLSLFRVLFASQERLLAGLDVLLDDPTTFWAPALQGLPDDLRRAPTVVARAREGMTARWSGWTPAQREAALEALPYVWGDVRQDEELQGWLRARLREGAARRPGASDTEREVARILAVYLPELLPEDLRQGFDLADPETAAWAVSMTALAPTAEAYDALAAARRQADARTRRAYYARWLDAADPAVARRANLDALADPDGALRADALSWLHQRPEAGDEARFAAALADPDAQVRLRAASLLASATEDATVVALVKALDDPDAAVRAAALVSLEEIKKVREQKTFWRRYAEEGGGGDR